MAAFDCEIHDLYKSGKEDGSSTGESCDREEISTVAEGNRSIHGRVRFISATWSRECVS